MRALEREPYEQEPLTEAEVEQWLEGHRTRMREA